MADRNHRHADDHARRSRSRSPQRHHSLSHRTRSPHRHHHKHKRDCGEPAKDLPFKSRQLTKREYKNFRPMFALYLDIQKGKILEELHDKEVQGRWKSFIGKWNRAELAEGWYDPETLQKAVNNENTQEPEAESKKQKQHSELAVRRESPLRSGEHLSHYEGRQDDVDDDSDASIGPTLPGQESKSRSSRKGPSIPNMQDLELKREMDAEDGLARRDDMRFARKIDRQGQKAALDELVPRAEAGTRERQIEKKKEVNETMKAFREKSPGAAEIPDTELMGGGDGIESYRKQNQELERKKTDRELRKEEILRARIAEREERQKEYRAKEEGTMAMLKALAKQNFG